MKIKWIKHSNNKTCDITEFVSMTTWSGSVSQAARSLEIAVLYSPLDRNIQEINIALGDRLKLYSDDNDLLIDAMVYNRERISEQGTITYSGYDELNRLLKSDGTYNFKNTTPEKITKKVCNDLKVDTGNIASTNVNIKSLLADSMNYYDIIMTAYTKAHKMNGKKYMPFASGKKVSVIEKGTIVKNFSLNDKINITGSSYSESLDSMINKVKIYDDKGKQIGEVKNDGWINAYGIFQSSYTKEEDVIASKAAKNMLTGIDKTASVDALGNIYCISGFGVKLKDSLTGLTGVFWIDSDSHTWENGNHTMSLELAFKNIMDEKEDSD